MPPASQLRHCGHTRPPLPSRHRHRRGCVTGWGGAWGHPPPKGFCPSQPRSMETGDKGQSPGTGSKEGAPKSVPPAVAVHGRNTDQPYRRRAAPFRSPQYPNIPGLGGGGAVSGWGGAMAGIGAPRDCTPPHTAAPPQRGSCRIRSAPPLFNTSGGAGRGLGGGQGAERPCGASPEPTGWGHKAHGSSIIKEDFIRARRWGDPQASPPPWGPCTAPMEPSPHPVGERTTAGGGAGGCGRHHPPINTN